MARRRQSVHIDLDAVRDQLQNQAHQQQLLQQQQQQQQQQQLHEDQASTSPRLGRQSSRRATSTAIDIVSSSPLQELQLSEEEEEDEEDAKKRRTTASKRFLPFSLWSTSPSPSSATATATSDRPGASLLKSPYGDRRVPKLAASGWTGNGVTSGGGGGAGGGKKSRRTDSVALSEAEDGVFLRDPTVGRSRVGAPGPSLASPVGAPAFARRQFSMAALARTWSSNRRLLLIIAGLILVSLAIFGPGDRRRDVVGYMGNKANKAWGSAEGYWDDAFKAAHPEAGVNAPAVEAPQQATSTIVLPPMEPQRGSNERPTNHLGMAGPSLLSSVREKPEMHADRAKTTRCDSNEGRFSDWRGEKRPEVQYAIMIDAGSTGSRVHVYKFNFCSSSPELEDEVFQMIKGGLSEYKADAKGAADSLRPLLKTALDSVPKHLQRCTPISVKATAGLRLLGPEMSKRILDSVREMLVREYPFPIADGRDPSASPRGIEIMEGRDEGVFAWITVNYLLDRIGSSNSGNLALDDVQPKTAAVLDLGGASTQIVFEPVQQSGEQGMHPGEHVYELKDFGGKTYTLYQNSYLGYGLMQARKSINSLATFTYSLAHPDQVRLGEAPTAPWLATGGVKIPNPCFEEGKEKTVKVKVPNEAEEKEVKVVGTSGGFDACRRLVEVTMDKDAVCTRPPCSFAGVYQPSLMKAFAASPIIALSYFYDRLEPLGLNASFSIAQLEKLARNVCSPRSTWTKLFDDRAMAELDDRPETCLDLTFQLSLLKLGYELDDQRQITVAKKLGGNELGWCLGAQLQVLEEGVLCKA